jgi:hypothetical protein
VGWFLVALLSAPVASAQSLGALRVTVVDPSGAVIVGAHVTVADVTVDTGARGEAAFGPLEPGRYTVRVESDGFETATLSDVRVRGETRREVKLAIAKLVETVRVGRDPRDRASDPRGDAFTMVLGQAEIDELPDDPDEMEQALRDMAGPGAVMRVNGFRGGKLPKKDQIQQIRFRRNMFAADTHELGFMGVDITTKPGLDVWRGSTNIGLRHSALNARNAFAPVKGDERNERYDVTVNGPLWKEHTSMSLSVGRVDAFDTKTIVAALPSGFFADSVRKPNDALNASLRVEHALTKAQMLRAEFQRSHSAADNLGVGDFDLPERAYGQTRDESVFRVSLSGSLRKVLFNDLRVQWRREEVAFAPVSTAPAVLVLNAFDAGGAQVGGSRGFNLFELNDDLDIAAGRHALRAGVQLEAGRYHTSELRNATGTFTFASLDAYALGQPTTFTRNLGDPRVGIAQSQLGLYVQDDIRVRKELTISAGVRHEVQSHIGGLHLAPRGGITWSPFKRGRTTVRAGAGIFFDWLDAQSYEQAIQLDGTHQQIETIVQPGYPDPTLGGRTIVLPPGRVQLASTLHQPELRQAVVGIEQSIASNLRVNAMLIRSTGAHLLRGVNINAPVNGIRPVAADGIVTEIRSIAGSEFDALSLNVNFAVPQKRVFVAANYTLARSLDDTDSPFGLPADNFNLAAERGPAAGDSRHRFMSMAHLPLGRGFRMATSFRAQSALPYNITTGHDDNGDTVSNDRPLGVRRNAGRGRGQIDVGARISWATGFGVRATPPQGPQVRIVRGDNADPLSNMSGLDGQNKRYGVELYAQAYNLLNRINAISFSGVMTSPFFGQPTSAAPPRRAEIGTRLTF